MNTRIDDDHPLRCQARPDDELPCDEQRIKGRSQVNLRFNYEGTKLNAFKLIVAALLVNLSLNSPALAAGCVTSVDSAALKAAVMQQLMMVAALQCREVPAYNRFVLSHQGELQISDATLRSFFERHGGEHGEAEYDAFKTKAANLSGLQHARDAAAFCLDAHALFDAAENSRNTLAAFVEERSGGIELVGICKDTRSAIVTASAVEPSPVQIAGGAPFQSEAISEDTENRLADAHWPREVGASPSRDVIQEHSGIRLSDGDERPFDLSSRADGRGLWRPWQFHDLGHPQQALQRQHARWSEANW